MKRPILCTSNSSLLISKLINPITLGPILKLTYGNDKAGWMNKKYIKYISECSNIHMERNENEHLVDFTNNIVSIPGYGCFYISMLKNDPYIKQIEKSLIKAVQSVYTDIMSKI
jgi:hypothetical protein